MKVSAYEGRWGRSAAVVIQCLLLAEAWIHELAWRHDDKGGSISGSKEREARALPRTCTWDPVVIDGCVLVVCVDWTARRYDRLVIIERLLTKAAACREVVVEAIALYRKGWYEG
jgi:hypothetical protein